MISSVYAGVVERPGGSLFWMAGRRLSGCFRERTRRASRDKEDARRGFVREGLCGRVLESCGERCRKRREFGRESTWCSLISRWQDFWISCFPTVPPHQTWLPRSGSLAWTVSAWFMSIYLSGTSSREKRPCPRWREMAFLFLLIGRSRTTLPLDQQHSICSGLPPHHDFPCRGSSFLHQICFSRK